MMMLDSVDQPNELAGARAAVADDPAPETPGSCSTEFELNGSFLEGYDNRDAASACNFQTAGPVEFSPERLELILDSSSTLLPFHFLRTGDRLGRAVVKLLRGDGAAGTGFLVAPGVLLTNNHVLPNRGTAALTIVLANFEAAPPGTSPGRPASVPLDPEALFVTNAELDFTFCGVRGLDFLGSIALDRNSRNISPSETVNIIQHPRGRPKEVALRDNRVVKADGVVVHYECSTEPGSSGSPVFNNDWETVALHHASVKSEGVASRTADEPSDEVLMRFLNEGIRISAIAIWLETAEANSPELRDQSARLRGIFGGLDPQVGFFGALGRKAHGRPSPEVIVESYQEETDDLDLAFWNVRGMDWGSQERVPDIARVIAGMGMDLWCLAHADRDAVANLREHLASDFGVDYEFSHEPAGVHPALALLYRRSKTLTVERRSWEFELPEGVILPPLITIRATMRRTGRVAFQLVPVTRPMSDDAAHPHFAEVVRHSIRRGHGEFDWIVVGEAAVLLAPEKLHVLADADCELIAAAADRDGAVALLTGPRSKVSQVFVSPNLLPAFGRPETLTVARDRELPRSLRTPGGHQPIALRLSIDSDTRPPSTSRPVLSPFQRSSSVPSGNDDLEQRVRDLIAPILAKLLTEIRPYP